MAGSDSGGGAGIQADLKTFHRFGVYGASVITAVTAQNTLGVTAVHPIPVAVVAAQLQAVADDLPPAAAKSGMLATKELVDTVADFLARRGPERYVLDPVMVSTSGHRLLDADAEEAVARRLLPLAAVVTPNLHEAAILTGCPVESVEEMRAAARALVAAGARSALVKGGHLEGDAVDLFWDGDKEHIWRRRRVDTPHTHGTGCTLSAAIAAGLALEQTPLEAVSRAVSFVARAIRTAPGLGGGHGPVNHFAPVE
ncbi:MAG: bifunctional hydroxymethylpyrimidine kinase/phosphomethylpyrimidine kinase [Gemmatimonadota bacterium]